MEKEQLLEALNEVARLLRTNHHISNKTVQRIREALNTHMLVSNSRRSEEYSVDDVSVDIEIMFEELSTEDFSDYPLKVEDITVKKFLSNKSFGKDEDGSFKTTNSSSKSIRIITAFLILADTNTLALDDLLNPNLSNALARYFALFVDFVDENSAIRLDDVQGIYATEWASKLGGLDSVQLILEKSCDGSHLLVEEKFYSKIKNYENMKSTKSAYGWCVVLPSEILLVVLNNPKTETSSLYTSLHVQLDKDTEPSMKKVLFQRHDLHFDFCSDCDESISHPEFLNFIKKRQLIFSKKTSDILTFEKPFDAKTRKRRLSRMIGMDDDTRSSAANVIDIKRKENIMDEKEKEKLSKEMLDCIIDIADKDEDRFFELLDMGASINYRHPRLNCTAIHAVGQFYPEFFEEVLKRSHEEYNFLARDKNGHLASGWAFDTHPDNPLYDLMRAKEIEYGRVQGIFPDPLRDRPWGEVFPDGYYPDAQP